MSARENAIQIFGAAVAAVQPQILIPENLFIQQGQLHIFDQQIDISEVQKIYLVGAGKASAAMAKAVQDLLGDLITAGLVVTKYGHTIALQKIICVEAAHPVPDNQGVVAMSATIDLLNQVGKQDLVICLISGGASSLWIDVPQGISLSDIRQTFQLLLQCGASIDEVNTIRKHLSAVKGGQLLQHAPDARWFTFIISDVPGDALGVIASGPTVPDNTSFDDTLRIINRYNLTNQLPLAVYQRIMDGCDGLIAETCKEQDPIFNRVSCKIIGNNSRALKAAEYNAMQLGYHIPKSGNGLSGDAEQVGRSLIQFCKNYRGVKPACLLLGGETTVMVSGSGTGGRNQQMALSALLELTYVSEDPDDKELNTITFLSAGTDGTDGPTDAAGAYVDIRIISKAKELKLDAAKYLLNNDAYIFFEQTGGLLKTGATQTNVMDLVVIIIE